MDVVRSLASPMHNKDDYFQYYAADFNEEPTALHGSYVLNQAGFVNLALHAILKMYRKEGIHINTITITINYCCTSCQIYNKIKIGLVHYLTSYW